MDVYIGIHYIYHAQCTLHIYCTMITLYHNAQKDIFHVEFSANSKRKTEERNQILSRYFLYYFVRLC